MIHSCSHFSLVFCHYLEKKSGDSFLHKKYANNGVSYVEIETGQRFLATLIEGTNIVINFLFFVSVPTKSAKAPSGPCWYKELPVYFVSINIH